MEYLVFRLYGPMASWGEIAIGESRHSAQLPGKSAILGLLGAALGITRDDEAGQTRLREAVQLAVQQVSPGGYMRDYHTTQVPDSAGKHTYRTRRDELLHGHKRLNTQLSTREYRSDALAVVVVQLIPASGFTLAEIKQALLRPCYPLYLGRKACPLAAPLDPQIIDNASGYRQALIKYQWRPMLQADTSRYLDIAPEQEVSWEGAYTLFEPDQSRLDTRRLRRQLHRDEPLSRQRWQFAPRTLNHYRLAADDPANQLSQEVC